MEEVEIKNLTGMFLIAAPALKDPNFERTVVLICDHTSEGAFGIVINRILFNSFTSLIDSFEVKEIKKDIPVFYGGPVKPEQGYILFIPEDVNYTSINIKENLYITTSKEILIDLAQGKGPKRFLFALGFSGWAPGQLEYELMIDSWLVAPADKRIIFDIPVNERWKAAADSIGIDLTRLVYRQGSV